MIDLKSLEVVVWKKLLPDIINDSGADDFLCDWHFFIEDSGKFKLLATARLSKLKYSYDNKINLEANEINSIFEELDNKLKEAIKWMVKSISNSHSSFLPYSNPTL